MSTSLSQQARRVRVRGLPAALLAAIVGFSAIAATRWNTSATVVQLSVDMQVSAGTRVHLYVNDETLPPLRAALEPGSRRVYTFSGAYTHISRLRLDPTDARDAAILICGFSLTDDDGPVVQVGPLSADTWGGVDVTAGDAPAGCAGYRATSANPILFRDVDISVADGALDYVRAALAPWRSAQATWPSLVLIASGVLLVAGGWSRWPAAVVAVVSVAVVLFVAPLVLAIDPRLDPPTLAVSLATYAGRSAPANRAAMQVALVCTIALAAAVAQVGRARRRRESLAAAEPAGAVSQVVPPAVFATVVGVMLLVLAPDFPAQIAAATTGVFAPHWDMDNVVLWQSLAHRGMHALREYWFPYGGTYLFDRPAPWGGLTQWLYQGLMYGGLLYAMAVAAGGRLAVATGLLVLIGLGEFLGVFQQTSRYLLSVAIVLAHAAIRADAGRWQGARLCLWLLCGLGIFVYPEQLVYAAPACLVQVALDLALGSGTARWARASRVLDDFLVPGLTLLAALGVWWSTGQLAGTIAFYASLPAHAVYGAIPTDIAQSLWQPTLPPFVVVVLPFVFVGAGVCERWLARGESQRLAADVLVGTGLVGWMMLQKHLVRPWGEFQVPRQPRGGARPLRRGARRFAPVAVHGRARPGCRVGGHAAPRTRHRRPAREPGCAAASSAR